MFAPERSTRGQMKSPSIAQRGEGGVGDALPDSRHARSGPQRDDLLANTPRRVPEGTRKGFGEESARQHSRSAVRAGMANMARKRDRVCSGPNPEGRGFAGHSRPKAVHSHWGSKGCNRDRGCQRFVTKPGKAQSLALGFAPYGSSRKIPAAHCASQAAHP